MLPKVVIYNSVSIDGSIKDFDVDIALHYEVLGRLGADALLVGSNTAKTGIELFMESVPAEKPNDFFKPIVEPDDDRPLWVIADSRGILQGLLHVHRNSGYTRDIIVLVTNKTPKSYLDYLAERHYDFILAGDDYVDYCLALDALNTRYNVKTVATDSGGLLASVLLESGLVDEVHLLVSPQIVGEKSVNLFRSLNTSIRLRLVKVEAIRDDHVLLVHAVTK